MYDNIALNYLEVINLKIMEICCLFYYSSTFIISSILPLGLQNLEYLLFGLLWKNISDPWNTTKNYHAIQRASGCCNSLYVNLCNICPWLYIDGAKWPMHFNIPLYLWTKFISQFKLLAKIPNSLIPVPRFSYQFKKMKNQWRFNVKPELPCQPSGTTEVKFQ